MTRINVVPVSELSDQWLIAEYRELPRVLKGSFSILGAPKQYKLNKGHIKWARYFGQFTSNRFNQIIQEMRYRGFKINFSSSLDPYLTKEIKNDYTPNLSDLKVNRERLIAKYNQKPDFYRWTKRTKPSYLGEL